MREQTDRQGFQLKTDFYVYEHWRPDLDVCFYVGKGRRNRAYQFKRNATYNAVVKGLAAIGMCAEVRLVADALSEAASFQIEVQRIEFWRASGIELTNKTSGGNGFSGFVRPLGIRLSEEAKRKISEARQGIRFTAEHKAKLAQRKIGVKRSPFTRETRNKMRVAAFRREAMKRLIHGDRVTRRSRAKEFS